MGARQGLRKNCNMMDIHPGVEADLRRVLVQVVDGSDDVLEGFVSRKGLLSKDWFYTGRPRAFYNWDHQWEYQGLALGAPHAADQAHTEAPCQ